MRSKLLEKICIITIGIFILGGIAYGLNLSRVKTWSAEVLTHTDLNAEFDNIINHPIGTADITDGAIVNADINSSAGITASKLDLTTAGAIGSSSASTGAFTTLTASSATTLNGDTTIGNATGDALTFHPSAWTLTNAVTITGTWTNLGTVTTATINGGTITGITDLVVADGGTGVSTLTDGGVLLGSGTGAITPMAVLADGEMIVGDGTTDPVAESGATLRTSIGVAIGSDVQAYDAQLADVAGLAVTDSNFIVGNGSNWVAESGATARTSLGLTIGTDVQAYDAQLADLADGTLSGASTVSTGALTGTVAVANGGTNQTTTGLAFGSKTVSYSGNGSDDRNIAHGLGRTPIIVWIADASTATTGMDVFMTGFSATYAREFSSATMQVDKIQSVDGTNVQIGTHAEVNANGVAYIMWVM